MGWTPDRTRHKRTNERVSERKSQAAPLGWVGIRRKSIMSNNSGPVLYGHTLTYVGGSSTREFIAFGGYNFVGYSLLTEYQTWDYSQGLSNQLYSFDADSQQWTTLEPNTPDSERPPARVRSLGGARFINSRLFLAFFFFFFCGCLPHDYLARCCPLT